MSDTATQNPPGYRGMERDTSMVPPTREQPVDTFLEKQGTNPKADTAGYGGLEHPDTTGMKRDTTKGETTEYQKQSDTTGYQVQPDTAGYQGQTDTSAYQQQGQTGQTDSVRVPHDSTRIHRDSAGVSQPDTGGQEGTEMGQPSDSGR